MHAAISSYARKLITVFFITSPVATTVGSEAVVRFDTSAAVTAYPLDATANSGHSRCWTIPLELSCLIESAAAPQVDQMLVEIELLDPSTTIQDYCPRTVLASRFNGEISVEQSDEHTKHFGFTGAGGPGMPVHTNFAGDLGYKNLENRKFQHVAPLEIVAAAGTLNRGRGVFFKLRATPTQVLEGDKRFSITIQSPAGWTGGLLKMRVRAQSNLRTIPGLSHETTTLGDQLFLIATYANGDMTAYASAQKLVEAQRKLIDSAIRNQHTIRKRTNSNVFKQVAVQLDLAPETIPNDWLQKTLFTSVDPHADEAIRRLPVEVRIAMLDFQEAKQSFLALRHQFSLN